MRYGAPRRPNGSSFPWGSRRGELPSGGEALDEGRAGGGDGVVGAAYGEGGGGAGLAVDAEKADQLALEMEEGARGGPAGIEVTEGAQEEVE